MEGYVLPSSGDDRERSNAAPADQADIHMFDEIEQEAFGMADYMFCKMKNTCTP